ncbi:MAG: molybdate ABC transporter substrate-binding protein [Breznakibacter sp.]
MKKINALTPFLGLALSMLCLTSVQAQTVRVAAAGNLRYILDDIKALYETENPKADIVVTLSASGTLLQQIINGARFDVFMAADKAFPDKLKQEGMANGDVRVYAYGKLALWSNSLDLSAGLDVLLNDKVQRIAIAKPEIAPYGSRAVECMKYYNIYEKVKHKLVYADNIAQAAQFVQSGNAEVGFLAKALLFGPEMKGASFDVDVASYKPVEQAMVMVKGGERNPDAKKFFDFVLGPKCKPVFEKYGFVVP